MKITTGNFQVIAFDLDDTLYPEAQFVRSGFRAVAGWADRVLGISEPIGLAELQAYFDAGIHDRVFDLWLEERGLPPDPWVPVMIRVYRTHVPRIGMYPGARECLVRRRAAGFRIGLVTEGYALVQKAKIGALKLDQLIDVVVISDEDSRAEWKPSLRPFQRLVEGSGAAPERVLYVGDNPAKDFLGARDLGLATVRMRIPGGLHYSEEPPSARHAADWEVANFPELEELLGKDGPNASP
ncbi:MAG: HAD-IA family hydrolase [Anaerolineales bacterium]|jgi:putative hydrolase of the HAD superfamily